MDETRDQLILPHLPDPEELARELAKVSSEEDPDLLKRYWNLLSRYLGPQQFKVLLLTVSLLSSIGLQLLMPQITRRFIDTALQGGAMVTLLQIAVLFLGVALVQQATGIATAYLSEVVGWTATNGLRADLVRHCLQLDMTFHKGHTPGEMIERVDGDVTALSNFFSQFVIRVLGSFILFLGIMVVLFREDRRLVLAYLGYTALFAFIMRRQHGTAVPRWRAARQAAADFAGFIEERLSGIEDIRANGLIAHVLRGFHQLVRRRLRLEQKAAVASAMVGGTMIAVITINYTLAYALSAYLFFTGAVTLGTIFLIIQYTELVNNPLYQLTYQIEDLQKASSSIERVEELLSLRSQLSDNGTRRLPLGPLSVEFANVSFGYESGQDVLHDVSLSLATGQKLGLLGRTGSGKTTLARLLFRFYDPRSGRICLGDVDVRDVPLADIQQRVGLVTQDVQLFQATVRDNLTFFDAAIPDGRILTVLRDLGLGPWYDALPDGLDTQLGSGYSNLSAGEAQLLAFARVFLKDPSLVILDEPSSRLDPATEHLIDRAVERLLSGRTAIIIAHRLATVRKTDAILILDNGQVQEHGGREALERDVGSRFAHLLQVGLEEALN